MKISPLFCSLVFLSCSTLAQDKEVKATNLPPDPFGDLEKQPEAADYAMEVDRTRGSWSISAKDGTYTPGSHFANWYWTTKAKRWGNYFVTLNYQSVSPKMGVNVKIGDAEVKSYAPRTSGDEIKAGSSVMGAAYIPKAGEYPVGLLTGDKSNDESFKVLGLEFSPAPEGDVMGQSIDGHIELLAKTATTYSEMMRYEPKPEKDCLGFWVDEKDWAEWKFDVNMAGKFTVKVVQGCGDGNGGSEVAVLVNDQTLKFKVEETGGFQNWKTREIGEIEFKHAGEHKVAIKPLSKAGKAVMDVKKIVLVPIGAGKKAAE